MEKIKCLMKNIEDEIADAWDYAEAAVEWEKKGLRESASLFASMSRGELEHAHMNERIIGMVIEHYTENEDKQEAAELVREVAHDRIEEAAEEVREMLDRLKK